MAVMVAGPNTEKKMINPRMIGQVSHFLLLNGEVIVGKIGS
jgi:hypothetical protein